MKRVPLFCLCTLLLTGLCLAQPAALPAELTVTLEAADQPTADVVAEVGKQLGVQVGVVGPAPEQVTLSLKEAKRDEAVAALAAVLGASWVRSYVLEAAPPPIPYTPEQLLAGLMNQRDNWFESLPEEQRQVIMALAMLTLRPGSRPPQIAGAGFAPPPAQTPGGPAPGGPFEGRFDAVRQLILPGRTEIVTLKLQDKPLAQALFELTSASKFIVAAGADLSGNVTLDADKLPLEQVVAQIATAVNAQWRPIYLLSVPRALSDDEMNTMMDSALQSRMGRFWALPREERTREVQKWVDRLGQWGNMAKQTTPEGQPSMMNRALKTVGPKALTWMTQYMAGLPQGQREEIKPLVQALAKAIPQ